MKCCTANRLGCGVLQVCAALASPSPRSNASCTARAGDGVFVGHPSAQKTSVCEWLGIPYAEAPVGDLRFAAPARPSPSNASFDADSYVSHPARIPKSGYTQDASPNGFLTQGYDCPQTPSTYFAYPNATRQYAHIYASFVNLLNNTQSEDCLTLNIWSRPADLGGSAGLKPVLVWIYGGRFSAGTSNTPFYDGEFMADAQDVVVVTFTFRISVFGFPGAPELEVKNLALLDHRMAVSWVRDNIAAFGGDPSRITIAGQSSGAWAVSNWAYAFREDPIVAGLISHSGSVFSFDSNSPELAASHWHDVSRALGCGASASTLACMRSPNITAQSILAAAARVPTTGAGSRALPAFQITQDNRTVFPRPEYASRLASGALARTPGLLVQTDHESGFYRISAAARGAVLPEAAWALFEHQTFTCPLAADALGRAGLGATTYRARYMAAWDGLRLFYQAEAPYDSGAYHGADVNMLVGNPQAISGIAPSAEEMGLTGIMQEAWAAFAADPADGLTRVMGWPKYQAASDTLILLGYNTSSAVKFVAPSTYDFTC